MSPTVATTSTPSSGLVRWLRRRPLAGFCALALGLGCPLTALPALAAHELLPGPDAPLPAVVLGVTLGVLLPSALLMTWLADGRAGVRRLLSRVVRWRLDPGSWLLATPAVPATAVLLGLLAGATFTPDLPGVARALVSAVVALLVVHLAEELVWAGFVQARLAATRGPVRAAALTSVPFAALHLPLTMTGPVTVHGLLMDAGGLLVLALVLRAFVGVLLTRTSGSTLLAAVAHAGFNGANNGGGLVDALVAGVDPGLLAPAATVLLLGAAVIPLVRRRSAPTAHHQRDDRVPTPRGTR